jgi:surface carbohydrate biosynthesis protein
MSTPLTVLLPVETIARELDARLVLATLFGQRHHRILLVNSSHMHGLIEHLRGCLYVGKHIMFPTATEPTVYFRAKERGFSVVHLAEEGAIFMGNEPDWGTDLDLQLAPRVLGADDFVCCWGDLQRDYYRAKQAPYPHRVTTTGHPRFDIYKTALRGIYEDDARALNQRFGRFVLFNSNLTFAVDAEGPWNTFNREQGYTPEDDAGRLRFVGRWGRQVKTLPEFVELLHRLAALRRDLNFVVRPHPSDNLVFFRCAFAGVPNIHVIREGTVAPWLVAAAVVLHDGCTTGLEAHLLGRPVVNFTPVRDENESFLPNLMGVRTHTQAEAQEAILEAVDGGVGAGRTDRSLPELAHRLFANFRQDSVALFLDVLREAEASIRQREENLGAAALVANQVRNIAVEEAKHLVRRVAFPRRYLTAMHGRARFPGFDRLGIRRRLDALQRITGRAVASRWYSPHMVELLPASAEPANWAALSASARAA